MKNKTVKATNSAECFIAAKLKLRKMFKKSFARANEDLMEQEGVTPGILNDDTDLGSHFMTAEEFFETE